MEDCRKLVCKRECSLSSRCEDLIERATKKADAERLAGKVVTERKLVCRLGPTISGYGPPGTPVGDGFDCHAQVIESSLEVEEVADFGPGLREQAWSRLGRFVRSFNLVD